MHLYFDRVICEAIRALTPNQPCQIVEGKLCNEEVMVRIELLEAGDDCRLVRVRILKK